MLLSRMHMNNNMSVDVTSIPVVVKLRITDLFWGGNTASFYAVKIDV